MRKCSGFTLIEMMIVVAIIAVTIIAVPAMLQWFRYRGVGHATDQLRADLQMARMMAISQKRTCTIRWNHPRPNQYTNLLSKQISLLSIYRGGVHFMVQGPDSRSMSSQFSFNRQGMSTSAVPVDVFLSDRDSLSIYRVRVMAPGGISVYRWNGQRWQ